MSERNENIIFSRHTKRADGTLGYGLEADQKPSERFPSVTEEGEEKARVLARTNFKSLIEKSAENSILFISGASEEERTKATAEIIGDELANEYQKDDKILVFTKDKIEELRSKTKDEKINSFFENMENVIESNPDKKIVFTFPLFLKEFSLRPHHRKKETGEHTDYIKEIIKKVGNDEQTLNLEWFKNNGKIKTEDGRMLEVPSPQEAAETHIKGINRLKEFAQKFTPNRPINIGIVGHGMQLDALAVYLANKGKVNLEAFEKLFGNEIIQQPEAGSVKIENNAASFDYKSHCYEVPKNIIE